MADRRFDEDAKLNAVEVEEGNVRIDLYPIAEEVVRLAPGAEAVDPHYLAELVRESYFGGYVRVTRYPKNVDRRFYQILMRRVQRWGFWERKKETIMRGSRRFGYVIETMTDCCEEIRSRDGEWADTTSPDRIPLPSCWKDCSCHYRMQRLDRN